MWWVRFQFLPAPGSLSFTLIQFDSLSESLRESAITTGHPPPQPHLLTHLLCPGLLLLSPYRLLSPWDCALVSGEPPGDVKGGVADREDLSAESQFRGL